MIKIDRYVTDEIKDSITAADGVYAAKVDADCTHLISSPKQYEANGAKGRKG